MYIYNTSILSYVVQFSQVTDLKKVFYLNQIFSIV